MTLLCPYCQKPASRATGAQVYPRRPELAGLRFFVCEPCDARVGCHERTGKPFGTLANAELRALRQRCHNAFDRLWLSAPRRLRRTARTGAYAWLAAELDVLSVHFGQSDPALCRRILELLEFPKKGDLPSLALLLSCAQFSDEDGAEDNWGWHLDGVFGDVEPPRTDPQRRGFAMDADVPGFEHFYGGLL